MKKFHIHPCVRVIFLAILDYLTRIFSWLKWSWATIEGSKLLFALVTGIIGIIIIGKRDEYFQREQILIPQRAILLNELSKYRNKIEPDLISMTKGYAEHALDAERISAGRPSPFMPPLDLPSETMEATKWKIREFQKPLWETLQKEADSQQAIDQLISMYAQDPRVFMLWKRVEMALRLLPEEDRFISSLFMERESLRAGALSTMVGWNALVNPSSNVAHENFTREYSMPLRIYFYQDVVRKDLQEIQQLIVKEQTPHGRIWPNWLRHITDAPKPEPNELQLVDSLYRDLVEFRGTYVARRKNLLEHILAGKSGKTNPSPRENGGI